MTDPPKLTDGQRQALEELQRIASINDSLQIVRQWHQPPNLVVDISLDCSNLEAVEGGFPIMVRERFLLEVPPQFPFKIPSVCTPHTRWAGKEHVQWRRHLCLYLSPAIEWNPSDGMAGFIERLVLWVERAAAGELDAVGEPLHPPVAYPNAEAGFVVVRADAPRATEDTPWLGIGLLQVVTDGRSDLVGWRSLTEEWPEGLDEARAAAGVGSEVNNMALAFAIMLPRPIAFEYPRTADELINALGDHGLGSEVVLGMLGVVAGINDRLSDDDQAGSSSPLYLLVGTPSRGVAGSSERQTHLAAWRLSAIGTTIAKLVPKRHSDVPELAQIGRRVLEIGEDWLKSATMSWARVFEMRPELVTARDVASPAAWLLGKSVLVLGAGALGGPIAEACVRARASRVVVADKGIVHPGILVRQPYEDADIGEAKAVALAERLGRIDPRVQVQPWVGDVVTDLFHDASQPPGFDLVIDATADRTVRSVIERRRAADEGSWPTLVSVLVGHDATRGIGAISRAGASGGPADVLRRLGLKARAEVGGTLSDVVDDFFPDPPRDDLFQPEPGCSDVTFTGSAADVTGLAGQLLVGVLHALVDDDVDEDMLALVVRSPGPPSSDQPHETRWFRWPNDTVLESADNRWQIRLSARATSEMRAEVRRGARLRGSRVETGGTLLGGFDSAARVVWIDEATGPPPDSRLSEAYFEHGIEGVEEAIAVRRVATARVTSFVGMWHSHPEGPSSPSPIDESGMRELVWPVASAPPRALILIAGGRDERWRSWLERGLQPDWYARVVERGADPVGRERPEGLSAPVGVTYWRGGLRSPAIYEETARRTRILSWFRALARAPSR